MNIKDFKNKYYYINNIYHINSYIKLDSFDYYTNDLRTQKLLKNFNLIDFRTNDNTESSTTLFIEVQKLENATLYDEYHIDINFKKVITIKYSTNRSLRYACYVIDDLVYQDTLPIIHIDDASTFKTRGIIEGYYGKPWTHKNHLDMLDFMDKARLNTYMYAPKTDDFHRKNWDVLYPDEYVLNFKELLKIAKEKDIEIYYTISPGYHKEDEIGFNYANDEDFNKLFKKLDQLLEIGFKSFGLLLDDIDYNLKGDNLKMFKTPGVAHAHICNKVYNYLNSKLTSFNFVMCPTEYHELNDSTYRKDLRENLIKEIKEFYTGDNVCAEVLTDSAMKEITKQFERPIMIWENFPVTDFTYGVRQYIAPIENRTVNLGLFSEGYMINPMELYETSKVGIITCAEYAWNTYKYDSEKSFKNALIHIGQEFYEKGLDYINYNLPNILTYGNIYYENSLIEKGAKDEILNYISMANNSAKELLKLNLPIICEIKPWLKHVDSEFILATKILNNDVTKIDVLNYLEDSHFNGSELIDKLIINTSLLTEEEINTLIKKKRGNPWYRVWEHKRYGTNIC